MAAGADLERVLRVQVMVQDAGEFELSLPNDIAALKAIIEEREVALIIFDPLISRLGRKLDSHKDGEVRQALEPIAKLANDTGAAVLGVIHVNKTATTDPLTAVMGSRAFAAVARAVMFAVRDGNERLLCFPKSNLGPEHPSLSYRICGKTVGTDEDGKPITTAEVVWTGESKRTAGEVLEDQASSRNKTSRAKAEGWLRERLKEGPVASADLKEEAAKVGIADRVLKRAMRELGVVIESSGFPRQTVWSLPKEGEV
jgi:hypothetical protein